MSSPSRPRQVPSADVLCNLTRQYKFRDIESYLDSPDYTRETKVEWILYPRHNSCLRSLFQFTCETVNSPMFIVKKVFDILGKEEISSPTCTNVLCEKTLHLWYGDSDHQKRTKITFIIKKVMEKLRKFPEVQMKLFLEAILNCEKEPAYTRCATPMSIIFEHVKSIPHTQSIALTKYNVEIKQKQDRKATDSLKIIKHLNGGPTFEKDGNSVLKEFHEATILEIALHKDFSKSIIIDLIERGKKELVMLSKRSLLEGAMCEKKKYDCFEIVERLLHYGGRDLVMVERSWWNSNARKMNFFHFLIENKNQLPKECDSDIWQIVKMMNSMLDKGGKEMVLKTNAEGESILHTFAYFEYNDFVPIVRRIVDLGGESLLKIQDKKGNTILHHIFQQDNIARGHWETLVKMMNSMLDEGGKDLVLKKNKDGQSILHTIAYLRHKELLPIVKRIVEIGGADLLKIQNKKGNTILHHLLLEKFIGICYWETLVGLILLMLDKGGKELLLMTNKDGESILHKFKYFEIKEFVPTVRRIVEIGGADLLKIQDKKGDTILHHLLHRSSISKGNFHAFGRYENDLKQALEAYLNTLAYNNEVVIIRNNDGKTALDLALESQNKPCIDMLTEITGKESILEQDKHEGKTLLHKACEQQMYDEILRFAEKGGKELLMKQDLQGNSPLHLLPICCENHDKQFQCVQHIIKIGGKDLFDCANNEGGKPSIISQVNQLTHDIQQSKQMEIEQLKEQLVLEEKRGLNEIEIVKKWHEERHEKGMTVLEEKEKEIRRLEKVETSMMRVIDDQKQMIDKLQKDRQQFSEESEKKQQENDDLKREIESLKQQLSSTPSERSIEEVTDVCDTHSEKELVIDDFEEGSFSRATKEFHEVDECKVQREKLEKELECSICFDPFDDPHIVPECCHRFCFKCIDTAIKKSGKECPMCRKRISSKRSLRRDELIGKISKIVFSDDKEGDEDQGKLVTNTTKPKSAREIQKLEEEIESMKEKLGSQEEMLKQSASNVSQLEKRIAEKDGVVTSKEHENNALKQEINTLKLQYQEEVTSTKDKIDSQEEKLKQSDSNISQLEKRIAEKDGVITSKEHENNALKQENDTLKHQLSASFSSKRSRDENETSDNDDDDYIIQKKRSKPNDESEESRIYMNEVLESENEDLLEQLKKEKTSHSKTIERLENARKKLKEVYRTHQQ